MILYPIKNIEETIQYYTTILTQSQRGNPNSKAV